ncbi:GNAT family N-acetyltransferase [Paenibacillus sp. GCM10012307]|uniref:GNAT family N-acetyltransferase n=1 Tax=Paenibacillus roseus TaxID=2798579 RepID=A0A934MK12_9BACL|nr:GNAT family N-acetyltransferase [Paenibacillus roseus]MBJ6360520.1 GNAT family N-acetyltransferase [Paenibacillus roseus]
MTIIRSYRNSDKKAVLQLIKTELIPKSHTVHSLDGPLLRAIPRRLQEGLTLVASRTRSSAPVAFIHLMHDKEVLFVDMLVVHSRYQGRQLGRHLMELAETSGRLHGCSKAILYVDKGNEGACRFYGRLGYSTQRFIKELKCYELTKALAT